MKEAGEVHGEHGGEVVDCVLGETLTDKDAGVIDKRVDPPESLEGLLDDTLGGRGFRDVAGHGEQVVGIGRFNR